MGYSEFARGQKKGFCHDHCNSSLDHPKSTRKKGLLVNDILLRKDEGILKFRFFKKWQMLKFKVVYSAKISLTFSAIKKNNRKKKSFVHPEDN